MANQNQKYIIVNDPADPYGTRIVKNPDYVETPQQKTPFDIVTDPSDPYGIRLVRKSPSGSPLATLGRYDDIPAALYPEGVSTGVGGGNAGPAQSLDPNADAYIPPTNIIRRSVPKPTGTGTQTSLAQATPDEMLAFLGAIRNQAGANPEEIDQGRISMQFARPYAGLVQEESLNLPGEADVSRGDLEFYGYSPEEIDARMSGKALEYSTDQEVDAPYKIVEQGTGAATKEDIKESMKVRQSEEKPEKRNYMIPYKSEKAMARAAMLDAPDSMTGLKRRNLMRGYITASGKKYAITPKFLETNDPADLGPVLTDEQVRAAKADEAQRFLNETLENIKESPAGSQNPMLGQQSEASAVDPKASTDDPKSVQTYKENNQTPIELDADTAADMEYGGKTPDEIRRLMEGGFLDEVVIGG